MKKSKGCSVQSQVYQVGYFLISLQSLLSKLHAICYLCYCCTCLQKIPPSTTLKNGTNRRYEVVSELTDRSDLSDEMASLCAKLPIYRVKKTTSPRKCCNQMCFYDKNVCTVKGRVKSLKKCVLKCVISVTYLLTYLPSYLPACLPACLALFCLLGCLLTNLLTYFCFRCEASVVLH